MKERIYNIKKHAKKSVIGAYKKYFSVEDKGTSLLPDKTYLRKLYKKRFGIVLNLDNPSTFNEKLNWLKLNDRRIEYTSMVDKYEVKKYISKMIGEEYVIPSIGIWDSYNDINFDSLPNQFVIKCTHDSGSVKVIKDKQFINHKELKALFDYRMSINYYRKRREWVYKNVKPRILIEKYIEDDVNPELRVYKVLNFNGVPHIIQMINGDKTNHEYINYYDTEWKLLDLKQNFPNGPIDQKPECLNELLNLSGQLSQGIPFVRTDFYIVNGKLLFSEFTFYSDAGLEKFEPEEWDQKLGDLLVLPHKNK